MAEHVLGKDEVGGSIPLLGSSEHTARQSDTAIEEIEIEEIEEEDERSRWSRLRRVQAEELHHHSEQEEDHRKAHHEEVLPGLPWPPGAQGGQGLTTGTGAGSSGQVSPSRHGAVRQAIPAWLSPTWGQ